MLHINICHPLKIQTSTCPLKKFKPLQYDLLREIQFACNKCIRNKRNTEQKLVDFNVSTNSENSSTKHQSNHWISFTFQNKVYVNTRTTDRKLKSKTCLRSESEPFYRLKNLSDV